MSVTKNVTLLEGVGLMGGRGGGEMRLLVVRVLVLYVVERILFS